VAIVLQLHTRLQSFFPLNVVTAERHYRYRGITAFPITVSSSVADNKHCKVSSHWQHGKPSFGEERRDGMEGEWWGIPPLLKFRQWTLTTSRNRRIYSLLTGPYIPVIHWSQTATTHCTHAL